VAERDPGTFDGRAYQAKFDELEAGGMDVHGEARLVESFRPSWVLDAGCGTGRVAIELARRGIDVVGVDVDPSMIAEARSRAPALDWVQADLAGLALGRLFAVVVLAGNVPLFCPLEDRAALVAACARHVAPGGRLIAGFQLDRGYPLSDFDRCCVAEELVLSERWSTWDRADYEDGSGYAVSVWQRPDAEGLAGSG
jgi:SAM-dependent methyltransferase